jgi:hypothetical protein
VVMGVGAERGTALAQYVRHNSADPACLIFGAFTCTKTDASWGAAYGRYCGGTGGLHRHCIRSVRCVGDPVLAFCGKTERRVPVFPALVTVVISGGAADPTTELPPTERQRCGPGYAMTDVRTARKRLRTVPIAAAYLACDALWLAGDAAAAAGHEWGAVLRNVAWLAALLAFLAGVRLLIRDSASVPDTAGASAASLFLAAVPIVAIGLVFFPEQFPRDSSYDQTLLWLSTVTFSLCATVGLLAAIAALISKRRSSRKQIAAVRASITDP